MMQGKVTSVYERNETMRLIGHQSPYRATDDGEIHVILDQIADIYQAYGEKMKEEGEKSYSMFDPSLDIFLLGMIYGIRTERRKRQTMEQATA